MALEVNTAATVQRLPNQRLGSCRAVKSVEHLSILKLLPRNTWCGKQNIVFRKLKYALAIKLLTRGYYGMNSRHYILLAPGQESS